MANITISDLRPAGADLFSDSESYLQDLTDQEMTDALGGLGGLPGLVISTTWCTTWCCFFRRRK